MRVHGLWNDFNLLTELYVRLVVCWQCNIFQLTDYSNHNVGYRLEGWNNTDLFCIMRQNTKVWHPCPPNLLFATQFYFSGLQAESYFFQHAHWWPTQPMSKPTERKKKNSPCRLNDLMVHNDVETTQYEQNYNICLLLGFPIPFLLSEFWFHKFPKSTQFKCQIRGADREEKNQKGIKSNPH